MDNEITDIGDRVVVRIGGYPVGEATVTGTTFNGNWIVEATFNNIRTHFYLPPDFKTYTDVDGVAHNELD